MKIRTIKQLVADEKDELRVILHGHHLHVRRWFSARYLKMSRRAQMARWKLFTKELWDVFGYDYESAAGRAPAFAQVTSAAPAPDATEPEPRPLVKHTVQYRPEHTKSHSEPDTWWHDPFEITCSLRKAKQFSAHNKAESPKCKRRIVRIETIETVEPGTLQA